MALLFNQLENKLKGKIGDLVYYQLNGSTCVRSRPASFKDPKTEKQLLHREKFKTVGKLFHIFRPALRYEKREDKLNIFGTFYKLNWGNVSVDMESTFIQYDNLILTNHPAIKLLGLDIKQASNKISFTWEADGLLDDSYYVLCAVYCKGSRLVYVSEVKRKSLSALVNIPFLDKEFFTYIYTYRRKF